MKNWLLLVVYVLFTHTTFGQWVEITPQDYLRYTETITGRYTTFPHSIVDTTKGDVLVRTIKFNAVNDTTSQFMIYTQYLVSWERGWTNDGEQKWGPKSSPYVYFKISEH